MYACTRLLSPVVSSWMVRSTHPALFWMPYIGHLYFSQQAAQSTLGPPYPWASHLKIQPTLDGKQNFPNVVGKRQCRELTICLFYAILYKGLEHPRILVSEGCPGTNSLEILRDDYNRPISQMRKLKLSEITSTYMV